MKTLSTILVTTLALWLAIVPAANSGEYDGTIKLGGITFFDEAGDKSAVQETFNVYDGFSIGEITLNGKLNMRNHFRMKLLDINQDNRKAYLDYRIPSVLKVFGDYGQNRYIYDRDASVTTTRKNWRFGLDWNANDWLGILANYGYMTRNGDRLGYPSGIDNSWLGDKYDYALQSGKIEADFNLKRLGRVFAFAYNFADFNNQLSDEQDRLSQVFSGRLYLSGVYTDKLTHMLRVGYGVSDLKNLDLDYSFGMFQYTGIYSPIREFQFKYSLFARRTDDQATTFETDNILNDFYGQYWYKFGTVWAGYGRETNDDDRSLTSYNIFHLGTIVRWEKVYGKVDYNNRDKNDVEKRTLLQNFESDKILAQLDYRFTDDLMIGAKYVDRKRDLTDINVVAEGQNTTVYGRWVHEHQGSEKVGTVTSTLTADYTYETQDYTDRVGRFGTRNNFVGGRWDINWDQKLDLGVGLVWMRIKGDLDIEKFVIPVYGKYTYRDYFVELKYSVYNYDDYVLTSRFYTNNIVWFYLGWNFDFGKEE